MYTRNGKGDLFYENLWKQNNFGGAVTNPLTRPEGEFETTIPNGLSDQLSQVFSQKGSINGVFNLKNLQKDNTFFNIDIFASNIASSDDLNKLKAANDDATSTKQFDDLKSLLTGHVRVYKFQPFATKEDGSQDPSKADQNEIQEVFEGYFEQGGVSKTPNYGRWFKNDVICYLGYFSYGQDNQDYRFLGKGIQWNSDGQRVNGYEGIYSLT